MRYSEVYLRRALERGDKVGAYQGEDVFVITKRQIGYGEFWKHYFYIIMDDDNKLFKNGKVYGRIKVNGDVELYNGPRNYEIEMEKRNEKMEQKNEIKTSNEKMKPKNETKIEIEMKNVDQMLADATNSDWIKEIMDV